MSPIFVSAIASTVSALIAMGALFLSIYNYRRAKDEPGRVRQREVRDALRAVLEPAETELEQLVTFADAGRPLPAPTAEFLSSYRLVASQGERRSDVLDQARTRGVSVGLMIAAGHWSMAYRAQLQADKATAYLKKQTETGSEETRHVIEHARDSQREKDIELTTAKTVLRKQVEETLNDLKMELSRLNMFDRG